MQTLTEWTLDAIRDEGASFSWLEEFHFEWSAITTRAIEQIISGKSIILITDNEHKWFERYIIATINKASKERPIVTVTKMDQMYYYFDDIADNTQMLDLIDNMLDLSFNGSYFFWYVGKSDDKRAEIAKKHDNSYLWVIDEEYPNSIMVKSYDKHVDIKLLQLYLLFDKTLSAVLYGELDID